LLEFKSFQQETLSLKIAVKSGWVQQDLKNKDGSIDPLEERQNVSDGTNLIGDIPLQYIQGTIESDIDVYLDLTKGDWNFNFVGGLPISSVNSLISFVFKQKGFKYKLTTISKAAIEGTIVELRPKTFRLSSHQTRSGLNIVQIFIATISKQPSSATFLLNEPIPNDFDVSMIISNNIVISKIAKDGFDSSGWKMREITPANDKEFTKLDCVNGTVNVPFNSPNPKVRLVGDVKHVEFDLKGMYVKPADPNLMISLVRIWDQEFEYREEPIHNYFKWRKHSVPITVNVNCSVPVAVDSTDANNLSLKVRALTKGVTVEGTIKSQGICESNDAEIQEVFVKGLKSVFPQQLVQILNTVEWGGISVLTLKSILFPGKYMKLAQANCPGDLLLLGALDTK